MASSVAPQHFHLSSNSLLDLYLFPSFFFNFFLCSSFILSTSWIWRCWFTNPNAELCFHSFLLHLECDVSPIAHLLQQLMNIFPVGLAAFSWNSIPSPFLYRLSLKSWFMAQTQSILTAHLSQFSYYFSCNIITRICFFWNLEQITLTTFPLSALL